MNTAHRERTVLKLQKKKASHLLGRAKAIYNGLLGNPTIFVTPYPTLATLASQMQALDQAQQVAETRAKGAAAVRDGKAAALITSLEAAQAYVQGVADASPDHQVAGVIEAAGMTVAKGKGYRKPFLLATNGKASGTSHVRANVSVLTAGTQGKVYFNWQYSADGGKTWLTAPSTPHGRTDIAGLTPMETYSFRVSVTDAKGPGGWSEAVTLLVR